MCLVYTRYNTLYRTWNNRRQNVHSEPLITGRGATKWENHRSATFCAPPPTTMAKTSSSCIKTTSKLVVPLVEHV